MIVSKPPLQRATIEGVYREYDKRLTPEQLAECVQQPLTEIELLDIPVGQDGKIGRPEISAWLSQGRSYARPEGR